MTNWTFDAKRHAMEQLYRLSQRAEEMTWFLDEMHLCTTLLPDRTSEIAKVATLADTLADRLFNLALLLGKVPPLPSPRYSDDERDILLGHIDWLANTTYRVKGVN